MNFTLHKSLSPHGHYFRNKRIHFQWRNWKCSIYRYTLHFVSDFTNFNYHDSLIENGEWRIIIFIEQVIRIALDVWRASSAVKFNANCQTSEFGTWVVRRQFVTRRFRSDVRQKNQFVFHWICKKRTSRQRQIAMADDRHSSRSKNRHFHNATQHRPRQWKRTAYGAHFHHNQHSQPFVLMSYNILSQDNLEKQPQLYAQHIPHTLEWKHRLRCLKHEIERVRPAILCLQEVQDTHLPEIVDALHQLNYDRPLFKQRNGGQSDGCAIFYSRALFTLVNHHYVEFFQPQISVRVIWWHKSHWKR